MAYDGEDLEIMTKGPKHQNFRELLGRIVTEVVRWLADEDTTDESAWARRLRNWVRAELAIRRASG